MTLRLGRCWLTFEPWRLDGRVGVYVWLDWRSAVQE